MSEGALLKVGDHIEFLSGYPYNSEGFNTENGVPLIRIRDLENSKLETKYSGEFDEKWLIQESDILIGMDGDFHIVRWKKEPALLNQRILKAFEKNSSLIDEGYFYFWCKPKLEKIHQQTAATTVKHLSVKDLLKLTDRFPPLPSQKRIAKILSTIDESIEHTEALIKKTNKIKVGLMQDLFTRGVTPDGQLRPPHTEAPHLYKKSPLGWIPEEWGIRSLLHCLQCRPVNGIYKPAGEIGSGALLIGQTAISDSRIVDEALARRAKVSPSELSHYGLAVGDILMSRVYATLEGVGRPGYVAQLNEPAVFESNMVRLRNDQNVISSLLLFQWLKGAQARAHILRTANIGNQCSVNQQALRTLYVPIPSQAEQKEMMERIRSMQKYGLLEQKYLNKLKHEMPGLLHDLLSNEVHVTV